MEAKEAWSSRLSPKPKRAIYAAVGVLAAGQNAFPNTKLVIIYEDERLFSGYCPFRSLGRCGKMLA
jgi:hypothetical protein